MTQVETVRGPVDVADLGTTLMHEHVFVLNEEIRQNYPDYWDEDVRVSHAVAQLEAAAAAGITTIVDPTVIGLGRDIGRIKRVAALAKVNIIVATGLYTFNDVPFYFRYRSRRMTASGEDPMTELFAADITDQIAGTGVRAAFLKCAVDEPGLTRGVERVLRAVARAHVLTGAPVTVHTHPATRNALDVIRVLTEEGADLRHVVIGHSGDSEDPDYLAEVADAGCLLGMDRFGIGRSPALEVRAGVIAELCRRGYVGQIVLRASRPASSTGTRTTSPRRATTPTFTTTCFRHWPSAGSPPSRSTRCWSLTRAGTSPPLHDHLVIPRWHG